MASPGKCYYNTLLCCHYFSSSSVVSCAFSVLCVYSKFRYHPHPLGYLCARFCFCRRLHCWASPWRIIAYSVNHSLNNSLSLFDAPVTKACTSGMTRHSVSVFETYTKLQWKFPRRQRARVTENSCSKKAHITAQTAAMYRLWAHHNVIIWQQSCCCYSVLMATTRNLWWLKDPQ